MICPKCKELGLKSTVTVGFTTSTLAYCPDFYDENGIYHNHDGNNHSTTYNCSNGHAFTVSGKSKCPNCDFGKDSKKVTVDPNTYSNSIIGHGTSGIICVAGTAIVGPGGEGQILVLDENQNHDFKDKE